MSKKRKPYFATAKMFGSDFVRYPFPDSSLGGNSRTAHRYNKAGRDKAREAGFWITKDAGIELAEKPICMDFVICPPDRRHRDDDNILSAFKYTRDGIFNAFGLNDRLVRSRSIRWGIVEDGGAIYVRMRNLSEQEYNEYE